MASTLRSPVRSLGLLRLVACGARTHAAVALVGETTIACAPIRSRRLEAGRARALAAIPVVGHADIGGCGGGLAEADHREAREQSNSCDYRAHFVILPSIDRPCARRALATIGRQRTVTGRLKTR